MGKLKLKYDKVIIGLSIRSLIYSFLERIPIIYINNESHKSPREFEFFDKEISFKNIFVNYVPNLFSEQSGGVVCFGHKKKDIYEKLLFLMSMDGLLPFSNKITNIKYCGDGNLKIKTDFNKVIEVKANNILVFDETGIEDIVIAKKQILSQIRYSYFVIKKMQTKNYNFVNFHGVNGIKHMFLFAKKAIIVSEEAIDVDYIKFFIREYIEKQDNKEVEVFYRETYVLEDSYVILSNDEKINCVNKKEKEIIEEYLKTETDVYKNFLHRYCNLLFDSKDIIISKTEHHRRLKKIKKELRKNV